VACDGHAAAIAEAELRVTENKKDNKGVEMIEAEREGS
jgi:hypothetical protein